MRDSNVANAAKESTQGEFSHGLRETCTMSAGRKRDFAVRPTDAEAWVRAPENASSHASEALRFTARLTIDVTPEQRGRIKVTAFQRGLTMADMLRHLLAREFPDNNGDAP